MFGLKDEQLEQIKRILDQYPQVEKAVIFGSRAIGNYKKGSDVDLALYGAKIDRKLLGRIHDELNEQSLMPYSFDLLHYESIYNAALKEHIDTYGATLPFRSK